MALILNIDTSAENASISISEQEHCLCLLSNAGQKGHAAWLHVAIRQALTYAGKKIEDLDAVALTAGPGSYTGLRIGMAAAKGLCYALNIPVIAISTLEAMASVGTGADTDYICPMIDARRMEVFTALYNKEFTPLMPPCAMILNKDSFADHLQHYKIAFYGSGSYKFRELAPHENAVFKDIPFNAERLIPLSYNRFVNTRFASLTYLEPLYLKEYYIISGKS